MNHESYILSIQGLNLSNTDKARLRGLVLTSLVEQGFNTTNKLKEETDFTRQQIIQAIKAIRSLGVELEWQGTNRSGHYVVKSWGYINSTAIITDCRDLLELAR